MKVFSFIHPNIRRPVGKQTLIASSGVLHHRLRRRLPSPSYSLRLCTMAQEDKPQQTQEVSKAEPGGVMASLNHYVASEEGQQETLENTPLRVLGYFGRLGRVFGRVLAKGSRYVS